MTEIPGQNDQKPAETSLDARLALLKQSGVYHDRRRVGYRPFSPLSKWDETKTRVLSIGAGLMLAAVIAGVAIHLFLNQPEDPNLPKEVSYAELLKTYSEDEAFKIIMARYVKPAVLNNLGNTETRIFDGRQFCLVDCEADNYTRRVFRLGTRNVQQLAEDVDSIQITEVIDPVSHQIIEEDINMEVEDIRINTLSDMPITAADFIVDSPQQSAWFDVLNANILALNTHYLEFDDPTYMALVDRQPRVVQRIRTVSGTDHIGSAEITIQTKYN